MGLFDGIASAISGAVGGITGAVSGAVKTAASAYSVASRAVGSFFAPTLSHISNAASSVKIPSFGFPAGFQAPNLGSLTSAGISAVQEAAASAARVANDPTKIARDAAQTAGYSAAKTAYEINKAYRIANGLPVEVFQPAVIQTAKAAANVIAAPVISAKQAVTSFKPPSFSFPDAGKVAAEIAKATTAAPAAAVKAASDTGSTITRSVAAAPAATTAAAAPVLALAQNIPTFSLNTGPGSFISPSPKNGNVIDQIVGTRDLSYQTGGETFARGWESGDAGTAAAGAGLYGATTAIDMLAPLDAMNVGNKVATGRINEISGDEWLYGGIDLGLMALGAMTGGTGYVAGKTAMKAGKIATAAAKASEVGKGIAKGAKETAAPVALAALGAVGGNKAMIKFGKFTKPSIKATGNAAQVAAKQAAAVKTVTAAKKFGINQASSAEYIKALQKRELAFKQAANQAEANKARAQIIAEQKRMADLAAAQKKVVQQQAAAAQKNRFTHAQDLLNQKATARTAGKTYTPPAKVAESVGTTKAANTAPSSIKTLESAEATAKAEKAAIESTTENATKRTARDYLNAGMLVATGGMISYGLSSYLGGKNDPGTVTPTPDPSLTPVDPNLPTYPTINPLSPYTDPLTGQVDPSYWDTLNDQIDQIDAAEAAGTITPEQADAMRDQIAEQIDSSGGYFDAAFGEGTPYEAIENAAQDATRAIPGDPLEWFRQNGLAAPAMGGAIILVCFVVWWLYKRLVKGKHSTKHRHSPRASTPAQGKQVVVM